MFFVYVNIYMILVLVMGSGFRVFETTGVPASGHWWLVAVHGTAFMAWIGLFLAQTVLVYLRKVRFHRQLGMLGLGLAAVMPPLGVAVALVVGRAKFEQGINTNLASLAIPLWDIVFFTLMTWLGAFWRRRPDRHRRLMFMGTCSMVHAGYARFPIPGLNGLAYVTDHLLMAVVLWREYRIDGRIHPIHCLVWPVWILADVAVMGLAVMQPAWWVNLCRAMTGL